MKTVLSPVPVDSTVDASECCAAGFVSACPVVVEFTFNNELKACKKTTTITLDDGR